MAVCPFFLSGFIIKKARKLSVVINPVIYIEPFLHLQKDLQPFAKRHVHKNFGPFRHCLKALFI
jgi:hypothetical protein